MLSCFFSCHDEIETMSYVMYFGVGWLIFFCFVYTHAQLRCVMLCRDWGWYGRQRTRNRSWWCFRDSTASMQVNGYIESGHVMFIAFLVFLSCWFCIAMWCGWVDNMMVKSRMIAKMEVIVMLRRLILPIHLPCLRGLGWVQRTIVNESITLSWRTRCIQLSLLNSLEDPMSSLSTDAKSQRNEVTWGLFPLVRMSRARWTCCSL